MSTLPSYHTDAQRVNPRPSIPSTEQQRRVVGPYTVILSHRWDSCGGGYDIVTRANGGEVARKYAPYYPAAQRRYADEVRRREAEQALAMTTMLGLVDQCHCTLPEQSCPACRRAARHTYSL